MKKKANPEDAKAPQPAGRKTFWKGNKGIGSKMNVGFKRDYTGFRRGSR